MLNKVVFEDEITIWWDKEWDTEEVPVYRILCNGRCVGETGKTHFSMTGLPSETAYQVRVEQIKPVEKMVGEICVITGKEKRRISAERRALYGNHPEHERKLLPMVRSIRRDIRPRRRGRRVREARKLQLPH